MLSHEEPEEYRISLNELFPIYTTQFLEPFQDIVEPHINEGMCLNFEICDREHKNKVNPILRLAQPEDAIEIVKIYTELYDGTYPYKEMEDEAEVRKMIKDPSIQWIIFQDPHYTIAGCVTFILDFENRRGYIRGFMLKKKYQGYLDITKAMIGSMIGMVHQYHNQIYVWYVENRTAHSKSQYSMWVCGIAPIGFYPNKDVFHGEVESDLMQVLYDERALRVFRSQENPIFIPAVESCYLYSDTRYNLGLYSTHNPDVSLDKKKVKSLRRQLIKSIEKDSFGYETITFTFSRTNSFFRFLYTPQVKNFEKTTYNVHTLEELYIFITEFMRCGKELNIRYCEIFLSAYRPDHQKLFYDAGLLPRGYIPSWKHNPITNRFEDYVLFNWFKGQVNHDIKLIDEGKKLLEILNHDTEEYGEQLVENDLIAYSHALYYNFKEKISHICEYPRTIKTTLLSGLGVYLFLLIGSILIANDRGYNIMTHTVSQLGSRTSTPMPFVFNCACAIGGFTTILLYCYLSKWLRMCCPRKLLTLGVNIGIIGSIGIICVGIFSLDRKGPDGMFHNFTSIIAFGGFSFALVIFGITIFISNLKIPKYIGLSGMIPLVLLIINYCASSPLLEWILLFSIICSLLPLFFGLG